MRRKLKRLSRKEKRIYFELEDFVADSLEILDKESSKPRESNEETYHYLVKASDFPLWPTGTRNYMISKMISEEGKWTSYGITLKMDEHDYIVLSQHCNWVKDEIIWKRKDIIEDITRDLLILLSYEEEN